jgi:hypothetical protein
MYHLQLAKNIMVIKPLIGAYYFRVMQLFCRNRHEIKEKE